ncbi:MAG: methyltransferase domain-containing protein, partial [Candidatus Omnitrophota bacterium]
PEIFKEYARIYDIIYKKKDYSGECNFLKKLFKKYAKRQVRDILDVACGTGNHVMVLAKKGFNVFAQDISADMLRLAEEKAKLKGLKIRFMPARPMQRFKHKRKFDAVIAMFSSIDYVIDPKDFKDTLKNIRGCLKKDGVFTFDFWNREYVLKHYSPIRKRIFVDGDKKVVRISKTTLDRANSVAKIKYTCSYFKNRDKLHSINELHKMKFYDIEDMKRLLDQAGFDVLACFPFLKLQQKNCGRDWNISIVATPKN